MLRAMTEKLTEYYNNNFDETMLAMFVFSNEDYRTRINKINKYFCPERINMNIGSYLEQYFFSDFKDKSFYSIQKFVNPF